MTAAYLQPATLVTPAEDDGLDALLQAFVAGVTGLDGSLVRPRWQPITPKMPEQATNWCALGVREERTDAGPALVTSADGLTTSLQRHELVEVLFSFYGPLGRTYAAMFRDGLSLPANISPLNAQGLFYRDMLPIVSAPELNNNLWFKRYDLPVFFARGVSRVYSVQSFLAARALLQTDGVPPITRSISVSPQ